MSDPTPEPEPTPVRCRCFDFPGLIDHKPSCPQAAPEQRDGWHYGPTDSDPDPGKMWHHGCGREVWHHKDGTSDCDCGTTWDADGNRIAPAPPAAGSPDTHDTETFHAVPPDTRATTHASTNPTHPRQDPTTSCTTRSAGTA